MAVRAVFFDFVGTLAFVEPDVGTVYADVARAFGLDLDAAAVERAFAEVFPRRPPLAFPRDLPDDARRAAEFAWWRAVVADTLRACNVPLRRKDPGPRTSGPGLWTPGYSPGRAGRGVWSQDEAPQASQMGPGVETPTPQSAIYDDPIPHPFSNTRHPTPSTDFNFDAYFAALYETFATPAVWRLDPAALEVLKTLRQKGLRTGVVSNFDGRLPVLLERLGLRPWLDVVVYSSAVGSAKPEAAIFLEACRRAGVDPAEALHVGDDPDLDYRGARRAGLHARWRVHDEASPVPDIPATDRFWDLTEVVQGISLADPMGVEGNRQGAKWRG